MSTITESEVVQAAQFKMITQMIILETSERKYRVQVKLKKLEGGTKALKTHPAKDWAILGRLVELAADSSEKTVITTRHTEREWANLDRLVRHIHTAYGPIPDITLQLCFFPLSLIFKKLEGEYTDEHGN